MEQSGLRKGEQLEKNQDLKLGTMAWLIIEYVFPKVNKAV